MKLLITSLLTAVACSAGAFKPNIIFIYADDMGWTGSSVEMIKGDPGTKSDFHLTPNLEKLAARGMVFSQAYSPAALCTPSRAAVLTGQTPAELHITTPGGGRADSSHKVTTPQTADRLPDGIPTIGTMLQAEGYTTALLGKWHIGRSDHAGHHGFDLHDGATANHNNGTDEDPKEIFSLTERGIAFMKESVNAGQPFYLQLTHYAVHTPVQTRPDSRAKFQQRSSGGIHVEDDFAGMTWDLDESLAGLFEAVKKLGIADNWKLLKDWESGTCRLFDLSNDLGEQNDLAKSNPEQTEKMMAWMKQRLEATGAQLPAENANYDPEAEPFSRRRNR